MFNAILSQQLGLEIASRGTCNKLQNIVINFRDYSRMQRKAEAFLSDIGSKTATSCPN
jgi:hypothetical protein